MVQLLSPCVWTSIGIARVAGFVFNIAGVARGTSNTSVSVDICLHSWCLYSLLDAVVRVLFLQCMLKLLVCIYINPVSRLAIAQFCVILEHVRLL